MRPGEQDPKRKLRRRCGETFLVLVLLTAGTAASWMTGAYTYKHQHPLNMSSPTLGWLDLSLLSAYRSLTGFGGLWINSVFPLSLDHYFSTFIWGMGFSPVLVLGMWLVADRGWRTTWGGRFRAAFYVCAYLYGSILTAVTQRWTHVLAPGGHPGPNGPYAEFAMRFHFPGTQINAYYNDYSQPATSLMLLLSVVLIFTPMATMWISSKDLRHRQERFSIRALLWWTALIAFTLAYLQFLGQWFSPPTGYSSLPFPSALVELVLEIMPANAIVILAICWLVIAPARYMKYTLLGVLALLVLDSLSAAWILGAFEDFGFFQRRQSPLAGPDRWIFQAGRIVGAWAVLAIAAGLSCPIFGVAGNKVQPQTDDQQWSAHTKSSSADAFRQTVPCGKRFC